MSHKKNIPQIWDNVWRHRSEEENKYHIEKQRKTIEWKRIKKRVIGEFGSFKDLEIIEIGAGQGTYSLLFALEGANVTVLDYSDKAIRTSQSLFKTHKIHAKFLKMNALMLDKKLFSKFDISMSHGTAEHFIGKDRIKFIESHFNVLNDRGITFIVVPNKYNLPYRFWMFLSKTFGRWIFGLEVPFSRSEFNKIGNQINVNFYVEGGIFLIANSTFLKE